MPEALLSRRAVVLAKLESSYNVDPTPTAAADAILVEAPEYSTDAQVLERNFSRFDLDQMPHRVGRKVAMMKFTCEVRSNGRSNSGVAGDAPKLARLLRACGFAQTAIASGTGQVGTVNAAEANVSAPSWAAAAGQAGLTMPVLYTIVVTTAGASGSAKVSITPDPQAVAASVDAAQTDVVVTTATPIDLKSGGSGAQVTPTFTGNLSLGDTWKVWVWPVGLLYSPISASFESLTLYMYFDGLLHKMTGALGSFSIKAEAGGFAKIEFTFTGQYVAPTDAAIPTTPTYETQQPAIVELSQLMIGGYSQVVANWGIDCNNEIVPRIDANASEGYNGVRLTSRAVDGTIDPEAVLVANFDFWGKMTSGEQMLARMKVGQTAGNRFWMIGPNVQFGPLSYGERDQIRTLDTNLKFSRAFGNDSLFLVIS